MQDSKIIVGSEEWCSLPSLGIPAIKVRVDSGAKTSSIHAFNIQAFNRDNSPWVSFEIHPLQNNRKTTLRCEMPVVDRRSVKSTSGIAEKRYVISVAMKIGEYSWDIQLTLANRDAMGYRMLLGREAMLHRMLVDPAGSFHLGEKSLEDIENLYGKQDNVRGGLRIGVLASDPDLYSNQRIMQAGLDRGHDMVFLNIKECYVKLDADTPEVHYRGGALLNDLDAVIPRIRPSATYYGCALTRHFESLGIYSLNRSGAISQSRDKLFSLQMLHASGVDIPTSGFANAPADTSELIAMVGCAPLIIKLLEGTQDGGIVLAETPKEAESVIQPFKKQQANVLVQEFVREAKNKDLRCFVIDGKVVGSIERTAAPGDFRANIDHGGTAKAAKISKKERSLAVKAAKTMGLMVAGVDIIRSSKGPLLLGVNASPGLQGIEAATGKNIASLMIAAIEKKLKWE